MVGEYAIRCQLQIEFRTPKLNNTEALSEALIPALFRIVLRFIMTVLHFQGQIDRHVIDLESTLAALLLNLSRYGPNNSDLSKRRRRLFRSTSECCLSRFRLYDTI